MKMLILGHKGMLGSDLMERLGAAHAVAGRDVEDFDLVSPADCRRVVAEADPEIVINAAAYTNVDGCERDPETCLAVNGEGVRNLALACRGRAVTLVHFSTDYVFDGRKGHDYVEEDPPAPLNAYGVSKFRGEVHLRELAPRFLLIRTAWLYGSRGNHFVKAILAKADRGEALEVVDDQVGSPTCSWDLAGAVKLLVEGGHTGVFHVTSRGHCSWYEFACRIVETAGRRDAIVRPIGTDQLARPALRPAWSVLSCRKFSEATGADMPFWQTALRAYLERTGAGCGDPGQAGSRAARAEEGS